MSTSVANATKAVLLSNQDGDDDDDDVNCNLSDHLDDDKYD